MKSSCHLRISDQRGHVKLGGNIFTAYDERFHVEINNPPYAATTQIYGAGMEGASSNNWDSPPSNPPSIGPNALPKSVVGMRLPTLVCFWRS